MHLWLVMLLSIMLFFVFSVTTIEATTVDNVTDQPSTLLFSAESNHRFTFTLSDSIVAGEVLTLTFPVEFDTSAITENDIDVTANGFEVSTDSVCGSADISVENSSNVLTLTRCGGAIAVPVGVEVEIEIGSNASAYGSGINRIINPADTGSYYIALGGTSGNEGSIVLPIGEKSGASIAVILVGAADNPNLDGGGNGCGRICHHIIDIIDDIINDDPVDDPVDDPIDELIDEAPDSGGSTETVEETNIEVYQTPSVDMGLVLYANPNLPLSVGASGIEVLSGSSLIVVVSVEAELQPSSVLVVIGDEQYVLSLNENGTFSGSIPTPSTSEIISAIAVFPDGTRNSENMNLNVVGSGLVNEIIDNRQIPVPDAVLTVYDYFGGNESAWNAAAYGQSNPLLTVTGYFSWYVPNGIYVVYADKTGYVETRAIVNVTNNILAPSIQLERVAENEPTIPLPSMSDAIENIQNLLDTPEVHTIANIALPATIALATGTLTTLAVGFNLLAYLQYAFTSPLLLFGKRKRRTYGVVYNSITKVPIELATVRVFSSSDNRLVKSVVTSPEGKYSLAVNPGEYIIKVIKSGYVFPSEYLKENKADGKFLDVYTGQVLVVDEKDVLITANIPVDPSAAGAFHAPRSLAFKRFARSLQMIMAPLGVLISVGVYVIQPSVFAGVMIVVQCFVLLLVLRLVKAKRPKGWGIVYDEFTHRPVGNAVIRVFEPKYNKLVETALSDSLGRYSFLLGPNEYFVTYNKPGYTEKIVRPIDYTNKPEPAPLAMNVALQHVSGEQHVSAR